VAAPALSEIRVAGTRAHVYELTRALSQALLTATGGVVALVAAINEGFVTWWVGPAQYGGMALTLVVLVQIEVQIVHLGTTPVETPAAARIAPPILKHVPALVSAAAPKRRRAVASVKAGSQTPVTVQLAAPAAAEAENDIHRVRAVGGRGGGTTTATDAGRQDAVTTLLAIQP